MTGTRRAGPVEGHGRTTTLGVVLVEQAGRTSNEWEPFTRLPDAELTVVSNRAGWGADREIALPTLHVPFVSSHEAWTAAPAWMRGMRTLDASGIDVVVSLEVFSFSTVQASMLAGRAGVPHAVIVFETMPDNPLYRLPPWRFVTRWMRDRVDAFLCVTPTAASHLEALGCDPARFHELRLGVDTELFYPAPALEAAPRVLFVGMLRANRGADKGVMDIVAACRRLRRAHPDLSLTLVGDGHLRPQLERLAEQEQWLEVLHHVPRGRIPELMRQSRCLVLASKRTLKWEEQFGFVMVEAMACGLPVVATRSGAIPDVVADPERLVPEGDVVALAAAIDRSIGPDGPALGQRNRAWAEARYELDASGRDLETTLRRIAATGRLSR